MKIAVYPGSFDPITNGHIDIVSRATKLFDKVIVLVANNANKNYIFSSEERLFMVKSALSQYKNVEVDCFSGLTIDYAKKVGAKFLIRGLRALTDFDYELQLAYTNEFLDKDIDSIFFMTHKELSFISSSAINELVKNKVDVSDLVPSAVIEMYKKKTNL